MKNIFLKLLVIIFLINPLNSFSQNNDGAAAAGAIVAAGIIAAISVENAKESFELTATEWILKNTSMTKFNVQTIAFSGVKMKDMSYTSVIPFRVYEYDIINKANGEYEFEILKRYVLLAYGYPGFVNENGVNYEQVYWELINKDTWFERLEAYVKSSSNPTIDVVEALENGYVVNKGVTNKKQNTALNSNDLAIRFYDIDEDSYIVSDYSDDLFKLVYNESSLGLFNKKTRVLVQLRRKTILDISKYLSRPLK